MSQQKRISRPSMKLDVLALIAEPEPEAEDPTVRLTPLDLKYLVCASEVIAARAK